jgi:hypothetical protein
MTHLLWIWIKKTKWPFTLRKLLSNVIIYTYVVWFNFNQHLTIFELTISDARVSWFDIHLIGEKNISQIRKLLNLKGSCYFASCW